MLMLMFFLTPARPCRLRRRCPPTSRHGVEQHAPAAPTIFKTSVMQDAASLPSVNEVSRSNNPEPNPAAALASIVPPGAPR